MHLQKLRTYPYLSGPNGVLSAIIRANKRSGKPLRWFWCAPCHGYHMTSQKKRVAPPAARR
jgi:hypothetical protein